MTNAFFSVGSARRFTRNTVRDVDFLRRQLLVKRMPNHREARAESRGWRAVRSHYPVPRLYARIRMPGSSLLVYERWGGAGGLKTLLDLLNEGDVAAIDEYLRVLTTRYRDAMLSTARLVEPTALVGKLFHDRAAPGGRLDLYYAGRSLEVGGVPVEELADFTLIINGRERRLDWRATLAWLAEWAADPAPQWSAMTQGDPTDVNLGVPLAVFDYDTAGRNAVWGEFANFCWYTGFLGGYLVPRVNPAAFTSSPRTFDAVALNAPDVRTVNLDLTAKTLTVDLVWRPSPARQRANRIYWDDLVLPVWQQLDGRQDSSAAFRPYLALRIIGVFNLADLDPEDRLALIVCLAECLAEDFDAEGLFTEGLS